MRDPPPLDYRLRSWPQLCFFLPAKGPRLKERVREVYRLGSAASDFALFRASSDGKKHAAKRVSAILTSFGDEKVLGGVLGARRGGIHSKCHPGPAPAREDAHADDG